MVVLDKVGNFESRAITHSLSICVISMAVEKFKEDGEGRVSGLSFVSFFGIELRNEIGGIYRVFVLMGILRK